MPSTELVFMILVPLVFVLALLIGFLAALRGLRGEQRISAFRTFVRALRR
ncbi:hypothetical protein [Streptomyces sp. KL118A]|nr:hypothetical protein [Streptomyces sp. KL118A]